MWANLPSRCRTLERARAIVGSLLLVGALGITFAVVPASAANAPARTASADLTALPPRPAPRVLSPTFSMASSVDLLASVHSDSLSTLALYNGTYGLELFNAKTSTSSYLGMMSGGTGIDPNSIIGAGGQFYISVINYTTGVVGFDQVTVAGAVTTFSLPLLNGIVWYFPYGNATVFFVAAAGYNYLYEFNAETHALIANYSSAMPTDVFLSTMLGVGTNVYLGGYSFSAMQTRSQAWFGVLDTVTGTISRLFVGPTSHAPSVSYFSGIASVAGELYLSGGIYTAATYGTNVTLATDRGFLYEYFPGTSLVRNMDKLIPASIRNETIFAVEPWGKTIALNFGGYYWNTSTGTFWETSNLYTFSPMGARLVSQDGLLPAGFIIAFAGVTSESSGCLFLGGGNLISGEAQLVAIQP